MFILITPVKNEEKFIKKTASTVIAQTKKPLLWLIVDDGSTDQSPNIIKELEKEYTWIKSIRLPEHPRDLTFHYSYVCKSGIDFAIDYCTQNSITYEYIGLLDADTLLQRDYYENLISEFEKEPALGIASGCLIDWTEECDQIREEYWGSLEVNSPNRNTPRGSGRLWRKKCYYETGGCPLEPACDTLSNIKAVNRGWKIAQFDQIRALQLRATSGAEGVWKGYLSKGRTAHYLSRPFLLVLGGGVYFSMNKPYFQGIPYLIGYLSSMIKREPQIQDEEITQYWKQQLKDYLIIKNKN
ncbi:glycosyltransferase family 2 protein [Methanofollis formosanus]|nr:glycosyltransferase family A protein [Methanofollis formosanus]